MKILHKPAVSRTETLPARIALLSEAGDVLGEVVENSMGFMLSSRFLEMIDRDPFSSRVLNAPTPEGAVDLARQILVNELTRLAAVIQLAVTELRT